VPGVKRLCAEQFGTLKFWTAGAVAILALGHLLAGDRLPFTVALPAVLAVLAVVAWGLEWFAKRRRAAETWPRRLNSKLRRAIERAIKAGLLSPGDSPIEIRYVPGREDARTFAEQLHRLLYKAGWRATVGAVFWTLDGEVVGLEMQTGGMFPMTPVISALSRALSSLGFPVRQTNNKSPMTAPTLVVGDRPR
jgi:hypothetical protein